MWHRGLAAPRHVGSSWTRARTRVPCIGRWILNHCATREVLYLIFEGLPNCFSKWLHHFTFPPATQKGSFPISPHPHQHLLFPSFIYYSHPSGSGLLYFIFLNLLSNTLIDGLNFLCFSTWDTRESYSTAPQKNVHMHIKEEPVISKISYTSPEVIYLLSSGGVCGPQVKIKRCQWKKMPDSVTDTEMWNAEAQCLPQGDPISQEGRREAELTHSDSRILLWVLI